MSIELKGILSPLDTFYPYPVTEYPLLIKNFYDSEGIKFYLVGHSPDLCSLYPRSEFVEFLNAHDNRIFNAVAVLNSTNYYGIKKYSIRADGKNLRSLSEINISHSLRKCEQWAYREKVNITDFYNLLGGKLRLAFIYLLLYHYFYQVRFDNYIVRFDDDIVSACDIPHIPDLDYLKFF